jgi:acylphosphatase
MRDRPSPPLKRPAPPPEAPPNWAPRRRRSPAPKDICRRMSTRAPSWPQWQPSIMRRRLSPTHSMPKRRRPFPTDFCATVSEIARRFRVYGKVQGVYFRHSTRLEAQHLGLRGSARNLADGSVEVLAQGTPASVEALRQWLHRGPSEARVSRVEESSDAETAAIPAARFEVL